MHEGSKTISERIILPELTVYELGVLKRELAKLALVLFPPAFVLCFGSLPLLLNIRIGGSTKADTPAFEDDDFDWRLAIGVDGVPLAGWSSIARAGEG